MNTAEISAVEAAAVEAAGKIVAAMIHQGLVHGDKHTYEAISEVKATLIKSA